MVTATDRYARIKYACEQLVLDTGGIAARLTNLYGAGMAEGKTSKTRIDQLLVERGEVESRARAQALLMAGLVFVGGQRVDKPGQKVPADAVIELKGRDHPWVGRGGVKLDGDDVLIINESDILGILG